MVLQCHLINSFIQSWTYYLLCTKPWSRCQVKKQMRTTESYILNECMVCELQLIQFLLKQNKLYMSTVFRGFRKALRRQTVTMQSGVRREVNSVLYEHTDGTSYPDWGLEDLTHKRSRESQARRMLQRREKATWRAPDLKEKSCMPRGKHKRPGRPRVKAGEGGALCITASLFKVWSSIRQH